MHGADVDRLLSDLQKLEEKTKSEDKS